MAESVVEITPGSGAVKLHSITRTVGANTVHETFSQPGEVPYASYICLAASVSLATVDSHILAIMAGASLNVRIRRIVIKQSSNATTASATSLSVLRLQTAGTGGTVVTPAPLELADGASGATARTLPTAKGTEFTEIMRAAMVWRQTVATSGAQADDGFTWVQHPYGKPIVIPAGISNGLAIKSTSAVAGATVHIIVDLVETTY